MFEIVNNYNQNAVIKVIGVGGGDIRNHFNVEVTDTWCRFFNCEH